MPCVSTEQTGMFWVISTSCLTPPFDIEIDADFFVGCSLGLSTSPSAGYLYSNLWVSHTRRPYLYPNRFRCQITWPTDDYPQVTCVHPRMPKPPRWPHTPTRKRCTYLINNPRRCGQFPADALSASAVSTMPVIIAVLLPLCPTGKALVQGTLYSGADRDRARRPDRLAVAQSGDQ